MALAESITIKIQKMIELINQTTKSEDTNLIDAVNRIISKYQEAALIIEAVAGEPGTINNPIAYNGNMKLEANKYYFQNEAVYLCINSTEGNVYHPLEKLIKTYVEKV